MPINPADILPAGRMVEITRIDGDAPGPVPRQVPPGIRPGMLARIVQARQIGTNGSAVLMYEVTVGGAGSAPTHAQLYAADVNPLPVLDDGPSARELEAARQRYIGKDERSISEKELAAMRTKPLTFHATPALIAKAKAQGEQQRREAEEARQKELAKRAAEATSSAPPNKVAG